jgi:DNA-binding NarL/FixJ family response regulator
MIKNPWGILVVCRSLHMLPMARYVFARLGYGNVRGTSADGETLLQVIHEVKPMIIFLEADFYDIATPYMLGQILKKKPYLKIAVYSLSAYPADKEVQFIFHRAFGYINLQDGMADFYHGLKQLLRGEQYISRRVRKVIDKLEEYPALRLNDSKREDEVMGLLAKGYTTQQIADILKIGARTVERHKTNMFARYHIRNTPEMIKIGLQLEKIRYGI